MSLQVIGLLLDFGLFILIWIVQLVVYPGFKYYDREGLIEWHLKYTQNVSYIVLPLMLGQLLIAASQLYLNISYYTVCSFSIVLLLWASTFLQFVPLHKTISKGEFNGEVLSKLVNWNWTRTVLWTLLFVLSFLKMTL